MENCLTYALRIWRWSKTTDHIVIRRSHWGAFPHFAVVFEMENGDLEKREYVPIEPRKRWIPPLFFKGVEKITYYRKAWCIDGRTNHQS